MRAAVFTVDQRGSSKEAATDRVPATLAALADVGMLRPFERTAGDEFQGVLDDPSALATLAERLLREDTWNIGIGIGEVEEPLPESTRAGRGTAYQRARDAVTGAKSGLWRLRVAGDEPERPPARDLAVALGRGARPAHRGAGGRSPTWSTPAARTTRSRSSSA